MLRVIVSGFGEQGAGLVVVGVVEVDEQNSLQQRPNNGCIQLLLQLGKSKSIGFKLMRDSTLGNPSEIWSFSSELDVEP